MGAAASLGESATDRNVSTIKVLYELFNSIDKNKDGGISYSEFGRVMQDSKKVQDLTMTEFMEAASVDRILTWDEFITMLLEKKYVTDEDISVFKWARIEDVFNSLDGDKSGAISISEWKFCEDYIVRSIIKDIDFHEAAGADRKITMDELEDVLVKTGKLQARKSTNTSGPEGVVAEVGEADVEAVQAEVAAAP